jgi:hypothetical protein
MVEGLDAVLVLREDRGLDFYWPRWKEEYSLSVGVCDDPDEAFGSRNSGSRDF